LLPFLSALKVIFCVFLNEDRTLYERELLRQAE
jgi:hypothetical protein